ncbi:hypothetical protein H6G76_31675 [Nostoc sp. FACHB-152]|uniref:hypothetical protein n=1 Tax=unclassified Nostoc TaxID=2593658 RepID=UPI0016861F6C|nr:MULTISPECIES: hypothetical protein [unclassified Nostoc]MBD2451599.1 hypothetical protein [Nostoc sp. FACHB-152]MBD2472060.1 hypothetical protein [Nostoc sp. FACHB-145]
MTKVSPLAEFGIAINVSSKNFFQSIVKLVIWFVNYLSQGQTSDRYTKLHSLDVIFVRLFDLYF